MINIKKYKYPLSNFTAFFLVAIAVGCIQEIDIFNGSTPSLVIDGSITTEPGPQVIKLYYSTSYNSVPNYDEVDEARVKIIDGLGNEETFTYTGNGLYSSSADFSGVIGRSYQIKITLESGRNYESMPEVIKSVPLIDSVKYRQDGNKLLYYIDFKDDSEENNYYRWRYSGTFELIAPVSYDLYVSGEDAPRSNCYSWSVLNVRNVWRCWAKEFDNQFLKIENDKLFNGRFMNDFEVASIDLGKKFDRAYAMEIRQYSLTKDAFHYWNSIQEQMGNNGTIFETSNYQIRGNVYSVDDKDELVLGYFSASAVSKKRVFTLDYKDTFGPIECVSNDRGCYQERCLDCRKYSTNSTNVKPVFWPN